MAVKYETELRHKERKQDFLSEQLTKIDRSESEENWLSERERKQRQHERESTECALFCENKNRPHTHTRSSLSHRSCAARISSSRMWKKIIEFFPFFIASCFCSRRHQHMQARVIHENARERARKHRTYTRESLRERRESRERERPTRRRGSKSESRKLERKEIFPTRNQLENCRHTI
jgi:hypothetical protein